MQSDIRQHSEKFPRSIVIRSKIALVMAISVSCLGSAFTEEVITSLTKVADLPQISYGSITNRSPSSPRGGILQIDNKLWFTTYGGGQHTLGAILTYDLNSETFQSQYSFGDPVPSDPSKVRHDGFNPWKATLTMGEDGRVYYATTYGGSSWSSGNNGGAVGSFDPTTIQTNGVSVEWSGGVSGSEPRSLYNGPIYVSTPSGGALYQLTYAGGSTQGLGSVQKITLGETPMVTQLAAFNGTTNGSQPQGGMLLVGDKIYFTTGAAGSSANPTNTTLQVIDTITDTVTVLSNNFNPIAAGATPTTMSSPTALPTNGNGGYSTPVYDSDRNAIYSLALTGGILKWDLTTGVVDPFSILPNSDQSTGSFFADPIMFGDSLYYIRQASGGTGGLLYRYDLESEQIFLLYTLAAYGGNAGVQSGALSMVNEGGKEVIYFLTSGNSASNNLGALFRLEVTAVPEPGSVGLMFFGAGVLAFLRRRKKR